MNQPMVYVVYFSLKSKFGSSTELESSLTIPGSLFLTSNEEFSNDRGQNCTNRLHVKPDPCAKLGRFDIGIVGIVIFSIRLYESG